MALFLWTSYREDDVTEKTKYWVDLWEEIIEDFSKTAYDKELINPHLLLMNLLDEIKYNRLINDKNNAYFLEKLKIFVNTDEVVKKLLGTDFNLLISELSQKSNRFEYFISLCEQTIKYFQSGIYFKESCELLKTMILDSQWKVKEEEKIYSISQNLIIELILAGYSIKTIQSIPQSLFDKYPILQTDKGEIILTKYPISVDAKNHYENSTFNHISYNEALKAEIDSLSISDRIQRLNYYISKEPTEGYAVFHIEGLKAGKEVNVGEVNFYSPEIENYWRRVNNPGIKSKDFNQKKLELYDAEKPYFNKPGEKILFMDFKSKIQPASFVNAAVKIKYRDYESARIQALDIIEKSLDILRLHIHSEIPFRVKSNNFYLIDSENLRQSDSFSYEGTKAHKELRSYDLSKSTFFSKDNEEFLKGFNELLFNEDIGKYPLSDKLIYSLHWYRKAFETDIVEDKLLNYWIVIESLITVDSKNGNLVLINKEEKDKFVLVEELVPYIELSFHSMKNVASNTYEYLYNRIYSSQTDNSGNSSEIHLGIPQNSLEACQLWYPTGEINLKEFVQSLQLLYPHIKRKVIEKRIESTEKFYTDTIFTSAELQRKLKQIKQDLLLIYRYRNLIVHNARFDNNILPYYVIKAENLAGNLIRKVLYEHIKNRTRSQQEILIWEKVKMERIIKMLENGIPVDLWEI